MQTAEVLFLEDQREVVTAEQARLEAHNRREELAAKLEQADLVASAHPMTQLDVLVAAAEYHALKELKAQADTDYADATSAVRLAEQAAKRRVRESLLPEHQQLARDIVDAARTLRDALKAERGFRQRLDNGRIGWGDPLQSAAIRDAVAHANPGGGACGFTVEELLTRHIDEADPTYIEV